MALIPKAGEVFYGDDGTVSVVLPDTCDLNADPTQEELLDYAEWIGIDAEKEPHLMWLAREGLRTPLPDDWRACRTSDDEVYYFNFRTGESIWDHPMDDVFKKKVEEERAAFNVGGGKGVGKKETKMKGKALSGPCELGEKGGMVGVEKRRLEKGAAGNIDSPKHTKKEAMLPMSSQPKLAASVGMSAPAVRLGRLGALGTPAAAQRVEPDVSGILFPPRGGGGAAAAAGKLSLTKAPDGVKGLEMTISQRVEDEIEARRRAMRLRHQEQITRERAVLNSRLEHIRRDGEIVLAAEKKGEAREEKNGNERELELMRMAMEKQYTEAKVRLVSLQQKLQREKAMMESTLQQHLADVKERLLLENKEKINSQRDASLVQLEGEKNKLSQQYAKELEAERQRLAHNLNTTVEEIRRSLKNEQVKLEEVINRRKEHDKWKDEQSVLAEAQQLSDAAVKQAKLDAARAIEAIHSDFRAKKEKLEALKKEAIEKKTILARKKDENSDNNNKQLEEEEERLKKALEEKIAQFTAETQEMLAVRQSEVDRLQEISSDLRSSDSIQSEVNNSMGTMNVLQEQRRLEEMHKNAMEQICGEHEEKLCKLNLFNPRHSDGYKVKLRELQAAWVDLHPAAELATRKVGPASISFSFLSAQQTDMPEEEKLRRINAAVSDAVKRKADNDDRLLEEEEAFLLKEMRCAVEEYRVKRMREIQARLAQYQREQEEMHQQRVSGVAAAALNEKATACTARKSQANNSVEAKASMSPLLESEKVGKMKLSMNEVDIEEAKRQEEHLRQRMCIRIEALQEALQSARVELQQRRGEALFTTPTASTAPPVAWQRPPPVPVSKLPLGGQEQQQQLTPRGFNLGQQCGPVTPILNHTLSTIPLTNSLRSSAQPSPTKPFSWLNTGGAVSAALWQENNAASVRGGQQNVLFEDRLRRAALLLKERRKRVATVRANMERAREVWLRDMKDCRTRHDRGGALMLWQIKKALDVKAEHINKEVISLKKAALWLREQKEIYRRKLDAQNGQMTSGTAAVAPAAAGDAAGLEHVVELLKNILDSTEVMKSYLRSPCKHSNRSPRRGKGCSHTCSRLSPGRKHLRKREKNCYVDVLHPLLNEKPAGVSRWLMEQQLEP